MPFQPVTVTDEELGRTSETLRTTFGYPNIHEFQEQAGIASLQGRSCLLNVPTGAGKTAAALYALFYHWTPGNLEAASQKIILWISPLIALMNQQVRY